MVIQHGLYSGFFRNSNKIEFGNIKKMLYLCSAKVTEMNIYDLETIYTTF